MKLSKRSAKFLKLCLFICLCGSIFYGFILMNKAQDLQDLTGYRRSYIQYPGKLQLEILPRNIVPAFVQRLKQVNTVSTKSILNQSKTVSETEVKNEMPIIRKPEHRNSLKTNFSVELLQLQTETGPPNYNVHAFYYPWYGSPEHDGQYLHWNHPYIRHWNKKEAQKWPNYTHMPPDDVGSNFYPLLGAYSSRDAEIIDYHMQMMKYARIGVIVVSWYPPGDADNQGREPDSVMPLLLAAASRYELKIAIHVEPYSGRNHVTMKKNLEYIIRKYGNHSAFYRTNYRDKKNLPLIYIYDSYLVESYDWASILTKNGKESIRNTELDCIFIGLLVEHMHRDHVFESGFDGFYTYFATNMFTYGSTWKNWPLLAQFAQSKGLLFIPSIGPGYIDTEVRPWNGGNTRKRLEGKYYNEAFSNALSIGPHMISITSFNEWHEGTQIEPAVNKKIKVRRYEDYGTKGPNFYLDLTKTWVNKMMQK
ncbi:glycoprotein endo-alpha-1,2-mannosidase-like isoform X2 [Ruditapes philippinarum]|uniref:glycoprotein endo-alpha-1,2-mannosidase-like isoform X2 n=1 Tax=Ruditapes philippinarum TaxID=129788 RepID=UPI00295A6AA2|nr:glycoprotein endo-alpha-1,2-mannosidase-like isoform X2 [Ruditapes philippinarum]